MPHCAATGSRLAQLLDAGLLTEEQLAQSRAAPGVDAEDENSLIAELLRRKLVTSWQLEQLAKGRTALFLEHGRYLLLEQIGRGGMGAVYKARHVRMGRVVALKIIDPKRVTDKSLVDRFRREVAVCSRLQHEHIVQTHDVGENKGLSFIVMEYVEGSDLASLVRRDGAMAPLDQPPLPGVQQVRSRQPQPLAHRGGAVPVQQHLHRLLLELLREPTLPARLTRHGLR